MILVWTGPGVLAAAVQRAFLARTHSMEFNRRRRLAPVATTLLGPIFGYIIAVGYNLLLFPRLPSYWKQEIHVYSGGLPYYIVFVLASTSVGAIVAVLLTSVLVSGRHTVGSA